MMLDLDEIQHAHFHILREQGDDGKVGRCRVCGKAINRESSAVWVHEHFGGGVFVTEDEVPSLDPGSDLGMQPIGLNCYRKHREALKPFIESSL